VELVEGARSSRVCARKTSGKGAGEDCWATVSFPIFLEFANRKDKKRDREKTLAEKGGGKICK
jgi:hypothetical protein